MSLSQCIGCNECVRECLRGAVERVGGGVSINMEKCFRCGHCVAVCPTDAIEHPLWARQPLVGELPSSEDMARYLRAARSVRKYKRELVPHEKMLELLNIGRYAQTGNNSQGVSYLVVEGRDKIFALNELIKETGARHPEMQGLVSSAMHWKDDDDIIFRGCSQLIFALSDNDRGKANAQFSLTFIALLAPTLGIGTCWAGMLEWITTNDRFSEPFLKFLNVPEHKRIRGAMMVGVPDVHFRRLAERDPLDVEFR